MLYILLHRIQRLQKALLKQRIFLSFSGVGGGLTQGMRSAYMSLFAEAQGSMGVVLNGPTPIETIKNGG